MPRFRPAIALFFVFFLARLVYAGAEPIVTSDLLRMRSVASIDVAREGQRAVFAVRSILTIPPDPNDPLAEPTYKPQSHLYVLDLADANAVPRQLTIGDRNDNSPHISPDGRRIAFVRESAIKAPANGAYPRSPRESESTSQIWIISVDGGEARQVTNFKNGCANPRWSPDGRHLLVTSTLKIDEIEGVPPWPMERPKRTWKDAPPRESIKPRPDGTREQIHAWLEHNASLLNPNVITRLEFQDEHQLRGGMRFAQLYLIDPDAANLPIETAAARRLTYEFYDHNDAAFMPDGQSIVYAAKKPTDQHIDRALAASLWRVNIDGSNDRLLLTMDGWSLGSPKPSRDGTVVAFTGQKTDEPAFRQAQLGIASINDQSGGANNPVWLTDDAAFPGSVESFDWLQAQPALVFNTAMRGGFPLMTISPGLLQPATLVSESDGRPIGVYNFAVGGGAIVYTRTSSANPCVLHVRDGFGDRAVLDLNPWISDKTVSQPIEGWVTRPDGVKVQYWLMEPTHRVNGNKYPLVVNMHGGPAAMWGPGEFSMWHEFQLLCSWGFGVVYCNPRGSGGYGYEFQKKNFQDWGDGPGGDVLAVVDEVIAKYGFTGTGGAAAATSGWIDRDKLVLTGGSYAGYLTAWIVSHDHRFKAAYAQRGVYDFETFYGEGNAWRLVAWAMGGNPFDPRVKQIIDRNNIMNYVSRIKTPLLIEHGSNDLRTGVSQSEMLYRVLKEAGKPVEYVRYPDAGHDMSRTGDPTQRMDRLNRIIEFFERYVENTRPAPVASGN